MTGVAAVNPKKQFLSAAGAPLVNGKVDVYVAGSVVRSNTWQDKAQTTLNTNPIVLNSRGECLMWLDPAVVYDFVLTSAAGAPQYTVEDVSGSDAGMRADLAIKTSVSFGSGLVGHGGNLNYAVGTIGAVLNDVCLNVKMFPWLARGDGVTDDTAAIQAAITANPNGALYFPPGTYLFSTLSVTTGIAFRGAARNNTVLHTTSATADAIVCTSTLSVEFSRMTIGATVTRTAGSYVKIAPVASYNGESMFDCVDFQAGFVNINFSAAATWKVVNCSFQSFTNTAIIIQNTATPDAGDSVITDSTFNGAAGSIHINQYSSGGLRITNNKFLSGAYHYLSGFNSGASATSILLIADNSSENASAANFAFNASAATGFAKIQVSDNQLSVAANAIGIYIVDAGYAWLDILAIGGNALAMGASATGINIGRAARVSLFPNQLVGNGASIIGVVFGASMGIANVCPQDITNIATPWSGTFTNATFSPGRKETGQVTAAAASTVYGPLYAGATATVSFAQAYAKAPSVVCNALAAGGGVGVLIASITTTGFDYNVLTVTNGGVVVFNWEAKG